MDIEQSNFVKLSWVVLLALLPGEEDTHRGSFTTVNRNAVGLFSMLSSSKMKLSNWIQGMVLNRVSRCV